MSRLHPILEKELAGCKYPVTIDRGGKHLHLRIAGRLTAILPSAGGGTNQKDREVLNSRSNIRRMIRELEAGVTN